MNDAATPTEDPFAGLSPQLLGTVAAALTLVTDCFQLDAHTARRPEGIYVQGEIEDDGTLFVEAPSNEFIRPALPANKVSLLIDLGWQPPNDEIPNFWRTFPPGQLAPGQVASVLVRTLMQVYGVTADDEFTLSPASLAAVALPDGVELVDFPIPDDASALTHHEGHISSLPPDDGGLTVGERAAGSPLPLATAPGVAAVVSDALAAGAILHTTAGSAWFGLRGTPNIRISVYVRKRGLTILLPPRQAAEVLATGLATVERKNASSWFLRISEATLQEPAATQAIKRLVLEALDLQPGTAESAPPRQQTPTSTPAPEPLKPTAPPPHDAPEAASPVAREDQDLHVLALSVARCAEVQRARENPNHPCHQIVCLQSGDPTLWQVPEPWAGNLTDGKILFISSNPSISEAGDPQSGEVAEDYPTTSWSDESITDFVTNRFAGHWATADGRFRRQDGLLSRPVAFWRSMRARAQELLGPTAAPATDYAMTEVVHCKSKKEAGVKEAVSRCTGNHLDRILAASTAPLIVIVGARARDQLRARWNLPPGFGHATAEQENAVVRSIAGKPRLVVYLNHPSGFQARKTFTHTYPTLLTRLQEVADGTRHPAPFQTP